MPSIPWLLREPNPNAGAHLICFPYADAPASLFTGWRIPGVDVLPAILPRHGEPLSRVRQFAEHIAGDVTRRVSGRYFLLGYSMGAWLAHAVATVLAERAAAGPERLFVLSAPPPHRFSSLPGLPDDDIVEAIIGLGWAPESDRDEIRADASAVSARHPTPRVLSCPITVIGGAGDPRCRLDDLLAWRETTHGTVSVHLVETGRFTVTEQRDEIIRNTARETGAAARHVDPIAVIGMACRFPGATSPAGLWELLRDGRSAVGPVPADRVTHPHRPMMRVGGFITDVDRFDAGHFGFSTREAHRSDPRLRLLLMMVQEAIDDAGLLPSDIAGPRTGIWVGESHSDYWDLAAPIVPPNLYSLSGGGLKSFLSGRVSYFFDLQGPSITLDTSCSASLTAIHTACRALRNGEVDAAFAAGAHLVLNPDAGPSHGLAKALSPRGRSAFASVDADGYVRAEGIAVVLLKRLVDAVRDGDPIHAVIEGSAVNANGRSGRNIVTTSVPGQVRMMREALADAGCHPSEIGYVEAHGPGTPVGDDVELTALHEVYGANPAPCLVGSVKTNIGHLEPAAGIAGLFKAVLALQRGQIPASLHHKKPAPIIDWDRSALRVPTALEPWPLAGHRRAAVSSFGLSGANAHAIVAAPPARTGARPRHPPRSWNLRRYWYTEMLAR